MGTRSTRSHSRVRCRGSSRPEDAQVAGRLPRSRLSLPRWPRNALFSVSSSFTSPRCSQTFGIWGTSRICWIISPRPNSAECGTLRLRRLLAEGLDRHEAVHALGSVLMEHFWNLTNKPRDDGDPNAPYLAALDKLTAASWLASG